MCTEGRNGKGLQHEREVEGLMTYRILRVSLVSRTGLPSCTIPWHASRNTGFLLWSA